jgi:hypothetical protein
MSRRFARPARQPQPPKDATKDVFGRKNLRRSTESQQKQVHSGLPELKICALVLVLLFSPFLSTFSLSYKVLQQTMHASASQSLNTKAFGPESIGITRSRDMKASSRISGRTRNAPEFSQLSVASNSRTK